MFRLVTTALAAAGAFAVMAAAHPSHDDAHRDAFKRLDLELRSPNAYRAASGAPGPEYWQQQVDYRIEARLDEDARRVTGAQTVTYRNNSPDTLTYLWFALDQNRFREGSQDRLSAAAPSDPADALSVSALRRQQAFADTAYGLDILAVEDRRGNPLPYTIIDTHMRIDPPRPLAPGASMDLRIEWAFNIVDEPAVYARGGFEHFPETDTYQYFLAQWFPRAAAYTDYGGWRIDPFLGRGEFTLEFGDFEVELTVPADHIVSATGALQNPNAVLTGEQRARLAEARRSDTPVFIVTPQEALANEAERAEGDRTWVFRAENVRDFAWASSRKYIWDAMIHRQEDGPDVLAMSFYPNEAEPLWSQYSTQSVVHALEVYSDFTFPYPYPTAQSVNTWMAGGMEYPMITFNGYRPQIDAETGERTYSRRTKMRLIGVIIHEVGHFYFPMIVNSDERQWTWMDEGHNSFIEYMAALQWEDEFIAYWDADWAPEGTASVLDFIPHYMTSEPQTPIMTQSDAILQFGANAYDKPTAAFTVLRETVMGREAFDFAFKEYARRWMFKRPTPTDFFRTMEDASGLDLDWFWRGWFFTTDHVDVGITDVRQVRLSTGDPDIEFALARAAHEADTPEPLTATRNREEGIVPRIDRVDGLTDFYNAHDRFAVSPADREAYLAGRDALSSKDAAIIDRALDEDAHYIFVDFQNYGGLVTPLPLTLEYEDGASEDVLIPAQIWRRSPESVTKMFIRDRAVVAVELDRLHEIADADHADNRFPRRLGAERVEPSDGGFQYRNQMADWSAHHALEEDQPSE